MIDLSSYSYFALWFVLISISSYVFHQRYIHPLASFPGPILGSLTNFWRFYHELRGDLPMVLHSYHKRYGHFIRVSPSEVNCDLAACIDIVYKRGGRHYLKSDFYDGFTAVRPNIFGTRNEDLHALRRRQMAHAFSQASLVKMEYIFDRHVSTLLRKLDFRAMIGDKFHLENILRFYSQDANSDLSLGIQFGTQDKDDVAVLPPLNDHIALAKLTGYVPWIKPWFDRYGYLLPWPYLQKLLRSRAWMRGEATRVTDLEFRRVGRDGTGKREMSDYEDIDPEPGRVNLFTSLVRARDPATGEMVERDDVISNAITFLTAGSHSTSSTLEIFWWYVLHYPAIVDKIRAEIDSVFPDSPQADTEDIIPFAGLESRLPYTAAFFLECFRLTPTFQHPAPRISPIEVTNPQYPTVIGGTVIEPGYSISASVYSLHRNPDIWGDHAEEFVPERWFDQKLKRNGAGLLGHFGWGHRACIGRNQSLIMIWKAMVEVLRRFDVTLVEGNGKPNGQRERQPKMRVTGFAELANSLVVKVARRTTARATQQSR